MTLIDKLGNWNYGMWFHKNQGLHRLQGLCRLLIAIHKLVMYTHPFSSCSLRIQVVFNFFNPIPWMLTNFKCISWVHPRVEFWIFKHHNNLWLSSIQKWRFYALPVNSSFVLQCTHFSRQLFITCFNCILGPMKESVREGLEDYKNVWEQIKAFLPTFGK